MKVAIFIQDSNTDSDFLQKRQAPEEPFGRVGVSTKLDGFLTVSRPTRVYRNILCTY